ncbi:MAG: glycerophosphodiester phosphodiesterase [Firmicutes bacterium HGW-Firmicutes-2]|jgi:glycerophosphoryl diester phosphodiesterase|nr:MAG: glycerophosphodiester phosphodiesterase [Firmicutes bacterium HGW-Firmicutes-2]
MEIIAHRGASGYAPENTLASFIKAVEMGAKAIEFDVQMTKDEEIVVIHDYKLNRTTDGKGYIMNKTLEEIKRCDAGSWFSEAFMGEAVPLLTEVLEMIPKDITLHVEIKKAVFEKRAVEKKIVEILKSSNRLSQSVISSFDHYCIEQVHREVQVKTGALIDAKIIKPVDYLISRGINNYSLNLGFEFVDAALIEEAHNNGLKVLSYTVNERSIAKMFEEMGVDGIFTNYPDIMSWDEP